MTEQTWTSLLRQSSEFLTRAGVESAESDARALLEKTLEEFSLPAGRNAKHIHISSAIEIELPPAAQDYLQEIMTQRAQRRPLQHILGKMWFRYLELESIPGVFIVRPETELVVEAGLQFLATVPDSQPLVVDLCSGSGAIALAIATENPQTRVYGVEKSVQAFASAERNNHRYGDPVIFCHGDARTALSELAGQVDLVISNPPYVPAGRKLAPEVEADPALALFGGGERGTELPQQIIKRAAILLKENGALVLEHDDTQGEELRTYAQEFFPRVVGGKDYNGRERWLVAFNERHNY